jgi:hypothetical protein
MLALVLRNCRKDSEVQGGGWEPRGSVEKAALESWERHVIHHHAVSREVDEAGDATADATHDANAACGRREAGSKPREFVPDGLAVWRALLEWETKRPSMGK